MQQEDDLRALAKIMEFGRAVSIFILVVHVYVYCYPSMTAWRLNLEVIDRKISSDMDRLMERRKPAAGKEAAG